MLALLTDAHLLPKVAEQITSKRPEITIYSVRVWRSGAFLGAEDERILEAARTEGLTLVTYDQHTIVPLVTRWMSEGRDHTGVIFIDERSIMQKDIGGQVRALIDLWDRSQADNWTNVVTYLKPPSH